MSADEFPQMTLVGQLRSVLNGLHDEQPLKIRDPHGAVWLITDVKLEWSAVNIGQLAAVVLEIWRADE